MSPTLRRNRLIALVTAVAMVVVICAYTAQAHDLANRPGHSCHCDWSMHFTGVAGSAPHPAAVVKPVLAAWLRPPVIAAAVRSVRKLRAHRARAPPPALSIG